MSNQNNTGNSQPDARDGQLYSNVISKHGDIINGSGCVCGGGGFLPLHEMEANYPKTTLQRFNI